MVTSSALQRTFFIRSGGSTGTGFTIDLDRGHYLVTAKHVLDDAAESIDIFHNGQWRSFDVEQIPISEPEVDAIALRLSVRISPNHLLEPSNFYVSQQMYFLGFPFGLFTEASVHNNGFLSRLLRVLFVPDSAGRLLLG